MRILHDLVLAEKIIPKQTTSSGIQLSYNDQQKYEAEVIATGEKVKHVKPGDKVRYYQGAGQEYSYEGRDCLFLHEIGDIELILS